MTIAFDFDGTLVEEKYPEIGNLYPGVVQLLQQLKWHGCKLVLYTMRSGKLLDEAVNFMRANGVVFDGVNSNPDQHKWTGAEPSNKVYADIYIDDHNLGIPKLYDGHLDWESLSNMLIAEVCSRL